MAAMTRRNAFAKFGVTPVNNRWAWSARNETTKIVVICLWKDRFRGEEGKLTYVPRDKIEVGSKPGWGQFMRDLQFAVDHCNGLVHIIMLVAKDMNADPRSIVDCYPTGMVMKVTEFNPETGFAKLREE
ncbi:MAG: hypothetical protein WA322_23245 [Pseudolabrys sp.]